MFIRANIINFKTPNSNEILSEMRYSYSYLLNPWCRVLPEKLTGLQLHFTEPEGSLPNSQASATCPYPGPAQSIHIPTSHLLEIRPNIIHSSTPRSPHWSLSLQFPHQDPIHPPLLTHTQHMPSPSHFYLRYQT